jgi:hypothetical protein
MDNETGWVETGRVTVGRVTAWTVARDVLMSDSCCGRVESTRG